MTDRNLMRLIIVLLALTSVVNGMTQLHRINVQRVIIDKEMKILEDQDEALKHASAAMTMMRGQLTSCETSLTLERHTKTTLTITPTGSLKALRTLQ